MFKKEKEKKIVILFYFEGCKLINKKDNWIRSCAKKPSGQGRIFISFSMDNFTNEVAKSANFIATFTL